MISFNVCENIRYLSAVYTVGRCHWCVPGGKSSLHVPQHHLVSIYITLPHTSQHPHRPHSSFNHQHLHNPLYKHPPTHTYNIYIKYSMYHVICIAFIISLPGINIIYNSHVYNVIILRHVVIYFIMSNLIHVVYF